MKILPIVAGLALVSALSLSAGCGRSEPTEPTPPAQPENVAPAPAAEMPTAAEAPAAAAPAMAPAADQAQGLIDKVKSLMESKDYAAAVNVLKELSALKLTPAQQSVVEELKAQAQKAMAAQAASGAADAASGLLPK